MKATISISELGKPCASYQGFAFRSAQMAFLIGFAFMAMFGPLAKEAWADENRLGPVSADQTLWSIASQTRPDPSITVYQYMLALVEANPHAFAAGNVNLLREGVILDLPDAEFATRVSPDEARRRVDEQMQWYADLSRQELVDVLRSDPVSTPIDEPMAAEPEVAPEPAVEPAEVALEEPEETTEAAVVDEPVEAEATEELESAEETERQLESADPIEVQVLEWPADPIAVPAPDTPEQLDSALPSEADPVLELPDPIGSDLDLAEHGEAEIADQVDEPVAVTPPEPIEESVAPVQPQAPAAAPLAAPPVETETGPSALVLLLVGLLVLVAVGVLLWWFIRSRRQAGAEPLEAVEVEKDPDESRFPTAAEPAVTETTVAPPAEPSNASDQEPSAAERSKSKEDTWSGFEAAVIGGGPVPVGNPDPEAEVAEEARKDNDDDPDSTLDDKASSEASSRDASPDDEDADFRVEELGWFEDEGFPKDGEAEKPDEDASDGFDLSSFREEREDEPDPDPETEDSDLDLSEEFDLAELADPEEEEKPQPAEESGSGFDQLPDLDAFSQPEDQDDAAEQSEPLPKPAAEEETAADDDELSDLSFDWNDEPETQVEGDTAAESTFEATPDPEPEPDVELGGAADDEPTVASSEAGLDDSEAEVMMDLARLSADAGDTEYALEVLEEIIDTGSETMVRRARELKDSLTD